MYPMARHSSGAFSMALSGTPSADSTALHAVTSGSSSAVNQVEKGINKIKIKDSDDRSSVSHTWNERPTADPRQTNQNPSGLRYYSNHQKVSAPYRGLLNEGATCYLNATLQVLFMTEAFRERVLLQGIPDDTSEKLVSALKELFKKLKSQDGGTQRISTIGIIKALGIERAYEQQDAVEYFLDILEKVGPNLAEVFSGTMRNKRVCSENHKSHDDSSFKSIQIALNSRDGPYSVEDGVRSYFKLKKLDGDNQMYCDICEMKSDTSWSYEIHEYPSILALHLQRFVYDYWSYRFVKNDCPMDIPLHLPPKLFQGQEYWLYAVINHRGSRYGGHYTADIRSSAENKWYCFNDSRVTETDESKLKGSREAYLLLYQKTPLHARHANYDHEVRCAKRLSKIHHQGPTYPSEDESIQQSEHAPHHRFKPLAPKWRISSQALTRRLRSFTGIFRKEVRGKNRFGPYKRPEKSFSIFFSLFDQQYEKTPKGETELQLTLAGLGRRSLTIPENMTHSELSEVLVNAYPKLAKICGGWLLYKCSGGGGQRKLTVIPPDPDGYNGQQLKTMSSNGKSTMYVVPLQEQIDTTPLPPDAREFEKMPKAQCTLCSQMVPLQCLPVHIKHCKMEHVDLCISSDSMEKSPDSPQEDNSRSIDTWKEELEKLPDIENCDSNIKEVWSEKTAECPLCKKTFDSDVIEMHAANCGLRTAEYDNFSDPINTLQSSGEILNWISSKVDQTNTFSICVSRNDIYNRGMQQWQRQKKSSPKGRLKVTFFGEAGVDSGALSKEFLTEMIAEIETRLFIAGVDKKGKNPVYCLNSLDRNYFRSAGEIMAVSLAQGGPPPFFLREWCFQYLCSGDYDSIQVTTSDVTDLEFSLLIEKVNSTDDMSELTDEILSCGYTGKVSADMKSNIIRAIVLHSTMRVVPMLDQLRKGLQLYDLQKVMEMHPDLCLPLFVPGEKDDKVDAGFILENCHPVFSDKGSVKYTKEVNVMNFFQDFLQEVEDREGEAEQMTAGKVMQWMTGQRHKPILPSDQKDFNITVKFNHDCDTNHTVCFPTVSACTRTITFPTAHLKTLNEFKNIMEIAMKYGESFDNV